jgi:anion-transporting  ArsA/GET3 family ATPase
MNARLARKKLVVVTGKGGVGKSTLSVTIGRLLAGKPWSRRALVLETDPRESLHQLLGVAPSGGAIVPAGTRLRIQNVQARAVHEEIVRERVRIAALARRIVASPLFQHFTAAAPGLNELAVLVHAYRLLQGRKADVVVLDAPATGHGLSLLAAPQLVADVISGGPVGELARELANFVADPERCGIVVVTQAEEMVVQEAIELIASLKTRLGTRPELVVVNALYPPLPQSASPHAPADALRLWTARRRANEHELVRLRAAWDGPRVDLPLVPLERGPALVGALAEMFGNPGR